MILGSAAPELLRQSSETLAGRISYYDLEPFRADELSAVGQLGMGALWLRGGFPRSHLAASDDVSFGGASTSSVRSWSRGTRTLGSGR